MVALESAAPPAGQAWGGAALETEVAYVGIVAPERLPSRGHRGNRRGPRRPRVSPRWAATAAVALLLAGGGATYLVTPGPAQDKAAGQSSSPAVTTPPGPATASARSTSKAAGHSAPPSSSARPSTSSGAPSATAAATRTQGPPAARQPGTQAATHTAAPPPGPTGPNLVADGSFTDADLSAWNNYATNTVVVSGGAEGGNAAHITGPTAGVSQIVTGLKPGQSYELTGWARSSGGGRIYIGAKDYDATGDHSQATTASSWTELPLSFTEGAGRTTVEIYCWQADAGTGYCSNISLRALS